MSEVLGKFDVTLPVPIDVAPGFPGPDVPPCQFWIGAVRVSALPLDTPSVNHYSTGDDEPPKLVELRVWITREVILDRAGREDLVLPAKEEDSFEELLIEATRRFITMVRDKTNQWELDTRHPVYSCSYSYSVGGKPLATTWPMKRGNKRRPGYVGIVSIRPSDFYGELTGDIWQEVTAEIRGFVSAAPHNELIADAKVLRGYLRYDASALYAAIASELMLQRICGGLLITRGMKGKHRGAKVSDLTAFQLRKLIYELDLGFPVKDEDIRWLFELRNKIAHGKAKAVTWRQVGRAIGIAEHLRQCLGRV